MSYLRNDGPLLLLKIALDDRVLDGTNDQRASRRYYRTSGTHYFGKLYAITGMSI